MFNVAKSCVEGEKKLGIDSQFCNPAWRLRDNWIYDADINVCHADLPEEVRRKGKPVVWVSHGTPEHVFQTAIEQSHEGYGHQDSVMLVQHWMRLADAIVTFWPRHQWIWKSLCDKRTRVEVVPLGVDKAFWKKEESRGKFLGRPSIFSAENCHQIKWPLDLILLMPLIWDEILEVRLHLFYIPYDMHRYFFPLMNRNGSGYFSHVNGGAVSQEDLKNGFLSTDFYCGLVRYGDFNRVSLEANACGSKTISYAGNEYSDYWINEGDQRQMAKELLPILRGQVEPRKDKLQVPDSEETSKAMLEVYNTL